MASFTLKSVAIVLIAVGVLAAGTFAVLGMKSKAADDPAPAAGSAATASAAKGAKATAKPALTVTTAQPQRASLPLKLTANGTVAAWQEASIGSESSGLKLASVRVNVGDAVKAGQVLATFAPESVAADVAQTRAALVEAEANASEAAANAERARTLQASGALSAQQINQFFTAEKTARARVDAARATLAAQQLRLNHTQVVAPDAGVISSRSATVGAVVGAGTELFRLIRQGRLEWRAEVTSAELGRISTGTPVAVTLPGGGAVKGRVRMVAPTVDVQTRAALVYVDLPAMSVAGPRGKQSAASGNAGAKAPSGGSAVHAVTSVGALPGMFARGDFEIGASDALTVPQQALVMRDGFSYLFQVGPDNRVTQLKVEAGRRIGDRVEITRGLEAGATVAVKGAGFLNEGDVVRVAVDAVAPVASAAGVAPATAAPAAAK